MFKTIIYYNIYKLSYFSDYLWPHSLINLNLWNESSELTVPYMGEEKSVLKPGSLEINMTFTRPKTTNNTTMAYVFFYEEYRMALKIHDGQIYNPLLC